MSNFSRSRINGFHKRFFVAILVLAFAATSFSYLIVRERVHEPKIDGCFIVGTNDHGFPLAYYRKTNENFSTYTSINDPHNSPPCRAYIKNVTTPSAEIINALVDFAVWTLAAGIFYILVFYLRRDLIAASMFRRVLATVLFSLLVGMSISSLSYRVVRGSSYHTQNPCPVVSTERRGYPLEYHERYSAACILNVGFYKPNKFFAKKYLLDGAFWSFIAFGVTLVVRKIGAKK